MFFPSYKCSSELDFHTKPESLSGMQKSYCNCAPQWWSCSCIIVSADDFETHLEGGQQYGPEFWRPTIISFFFCSLKRSGSFNLLISTWCHKSRPLCLRVHLKIHSQMCRHLTQMTSVSLSKASNAKTSPCGILRAEQRHSKLCGFKLLTSKKLQF